LSRKAQYTNWKKSLENINKRVEQAEEMREVKDRSIRLSVLSGKKKNEKELNKA
jgi:hypothetical protein